ncbi:MAG: recombinase RecA, partial [Candidatus Gracilibacteria bacterium]
MAGGKQKAIELALSQIEKNFGKGAIMRMGEGKRIAIETISTGSMSLDIALGGGIPRGRVIEIFGPESSGKTTLSLHVIAEAQKHGGTAAFIDAEHALDPVYAERIGVKVKDLLVSQPDSGEQALEITETLVRSNAVDVIVVDSVAALVPKAEIEGDMGDAHMGLQARLMSQALRKLTAAISKSKTSVIFINQIRMKLGILFGNPETTPGGNALKFYSSVRMDIRNIGKIDAGTGDAKEILGIKVRVKIVKNKVAPPFRMAEFDIMYNKGINYFGDMLDLATKYEITRRAG